MWRKLNKRQIWARVLVLGVCSLICFSVFTAVAFVKGQNTLQTAAEKRYKPELVIQTGHASSVNSVAFSPDGKTLASGSSDFTIKLWDVESGLQIKSLAGHVDMVNSVAFSPDGKTLASGNGDNTIKLWNVETGQQIKSFLQADVVRSVAFSPDGKTLASGSNDRTIKLWNVEIGQQIPKSLTGHADWVLSVMFSPDGKTLASGSKDKTIKIWNVETGQLIKSLAGHSNWVTSVAFSSDGKTLASGSWDKTIKLWNVETGQQIKSLEGHAKFIESVAFSPDEKTLASGSDDRTIKLWNVETGQLIKSLVDHPDKVYSVAFSPDGKTLASGIWDKTIKLWNVETGQQIKSLEGHASFISSVAFSSDGKTLASGSRDSAINLWNVETGQQIKSLTGHAGLVSSVAFSPDGKTLASGSGDKTIKIWNVETGQQIKSFTGHAIWVSSVAFSPNGKTLASGGWDSTIKLWNVETGQQIKSLTGHASGVNSIAFSSDGKTLASGSWDNTIRLWDIETGQQIKSLTGHAAPVWSVAFSSDGNTLASGSKDKTIKLWNLETGQLIKSLKGHASDVNSIAFSSDGETLASGSDDKTIKLWNVETGQQIKSLTGHAHRVSSVAFSPDGKFFVSGGYDATMKLWDMQSNKPLATLTSLDKDDWVAVTPDSQFDASAGALKLMHFVVFDPQTGYEVITLDQLKSKSFTPGLLKDIYLRQRAAGAGEFSITLYPKLEIQQARQGAATLNLKLENRGGGIGRVEVLVNGREFSSDATAGKISNRNIAKATIPVEIPKDDLDAGANKVEAIAWNKEGDVRSRSREFGFVVEPNGTVKGIEVENIGEEKQTYNGHFYAIVAGVAQYANSAHNLRYAAKDAEDMSKALTLGARRLFCGEEIKQKKPCQRVHIRTLTTEKQAQFSPPTDVPIDFKRAAPTKAEFQKVFAEIAARAMPEDVVVVYMSGHGTAITHPEATEKSAFPDMYLYPTTEATTIDAAQLKNKTVRDLITISSLELADWVNKIKAERKVMIFDTCAAGNIEKSDLTALTKADDALQIRALDRLRERTGFYVLMGSAANAVSYEASNYRQGLLTYSLLEALTGAKLREDKFVDVEDWFGYAEDKVELLAKNIGGIQRPRYFKSNYSKRFDVGQIEAEERKEIQPARAVPVILQPNFIDDDALSDNTLKLTDALITKLQTLSVQFERGTNQAVNYIPVRRAAGGISPSGKYTISADGMVTVKLVLWRDDKEIARLEVTADENKIVEELLQKIIEAAQKSN